MVRIGGIVGYMFYREYRLALLALSIIPLFGAHINMDRHTVRSPARVSGCSQPSSLSHTHTHTHMWLSGWDWRLSSHCMSHAHVLTHMHMQLQ